VELLIPTLIIAGPLVFLWWTLGRPAEQEKRNYALMLLQEGDAKIVCPHCHGSGCVTTRKVLEKAGIDGGKTTAALLTGGVTLLAMGLSAQRERTEATCSHCHSVWRF
jgi:hypothetical protein